VFRMCRTLRLFAVLLTGCCLCGADVSDLQVNNVPGEKQVLSNFFVAENSGIRILFVGNSITRHAPKPAIGWQNDCGMAASSLDKDYVHLLEAKVRTIAPDAAFAILQASGFETRFDTFDVAQKYAKAAAFRPDVVVIFLGANVPMAYWKERKPYTKTFFTAYEILRNTLISQNPKAKVFHVEGFYTRYTVDDEKKAVAAKYRDCLIPIDEIRNNRASYGRFNHPNDAGMAAIADKIWIELQKEFP